MEQRHSLLQRQMKRYFGSKQVPDEWQAFVAAVNEAYVQSDADRAMLERSLELTSQELLSANSKMRAVYERLIHSTVDGIFAFDLDCNYTVWNPGMERITGTRAVDAIGKSAFDLYPSLHQAGLDSLFYRTLAGETVMLSPQAYTAPETGVEGFIEGQYSPLLNESQEIIGGVVVLHDITQRKRAEDALQQAHDQLEARVEQRTAELGEANQRLKYIVDNVDAVFYSVDYLNGRMLYMSPACEQVFGLPAAAFMDNPRLLRELIHPDDRRQADLNSQGLLQGKPLSEEYRITRPDGQMRWVEGHATPTLGPAGELARVDGLLLDATDRKLQMIEKARAEEAVRTSEERFRLIAENAADLIAVVDKNGIRLYNSPSYQAVLGYSPEEMQGTWSFAEIHPEDQFMVMAAAEDVIKTGTGRILEYRMKHKNGSWRTLESRSNVIRNRAGGLENLVIVARDVTERKQAEGRQQAITVGLRAVVAAADDLITCSDMDSVYRRAVELGQEHLGLERCAIFVKEGNEFRGTYGTDRHGHITDEHRQRFPIDALWQARLDRLASHNPGWTLVEEPRREWLGNKSVEIGYGWISLAPIRLGDSLIGVFVNDAAISDSPLDPVKQEVTAVYCSLLGNLIERKWAEEALIHAHDELEVRVRERTSELERANTIMQIEIAERREAEQAQREGEELFRRLFHESPNAIVIINPNDAERQWPIIDCNEAFAGVMGLGREELIGQSIDMVSDSKSDGAGRKAYFERLKQEGTFVTQALHRRPNGTTIPIEITTSLISVGGRELILGVDRDITDRKQVELLRGALERILERASSTQQMSELSTAIQNIVGELVYFD